MLKEVKVFKDSVLGYIEVHDQIIWDLINCKEFQRLRRIKHLGGVSQVFHTAEHSRFSHSIGVYETTRRMINSVENLELTKYERILVLVSALLHDLGHGPFSHAFEDISSIHHEVLSQRIISENTEINKVLNNYGENLASDVVKVISHQYSNNIINVIISNQIDVDRLDYLHRDSHNSGAKYGIIDVERLFRSSKIIDGKICFKLHALKEVEMFLMSRICMYSQIYFHPTARSYEIIFGNTLKRYFDLKNQGYNFRFDYEMLDKLDVNISVDDFYLFDDPTMVHYMKCFMRESDTILSDLSTRFITRKLFKEEMFSDEKLEEIQSSLIQKGIDINYYLNVDEQSTKFYNPKETIYLFDENGIYNLEDKSEFVSNEKSVVKHKYIFYAE